LSEASPASARARGLRFAVVALLVALDLWSKAGIFAALEGASDLVRDSHGHARWHVLGPGVEWFTFMRSENAGAAFGRFASIPHVLVVGRVVAVCFLSYLLYRSPKGRGWFTSALVLVLSGALGNLYDNLFLSSSDGHPYGKVRDFIDVYFAHWDTHFPTFNVADSCITVGAVILLLSGMKGEKEATEGSEPSAEA
jgi:signal peptidase II